MKEKKVWLITGAGRGLGVDIAKAALAGGHAVVATGRDAAKVAAAVGDHDNLLAIRLDVTRPQDAQAAVEAAVAKFGRIDILVNNAGNFFAGFFEELSPEQVRNQIETLLFGPMNVTRAVLPVMRKQRSGLLRHHLLDCRHRRPNVLHGVCRREVRHRGVDGVAHAGDRPFRNPHDAGRAWFLPYRAAHQRLDDLRRSPPLTTTPSEPGRSLPPGRAWMGSKVATPPSSPTPS